jgi:hypothetical protein
LRIARVEKPVTDAALAALILELNEATEATTSGVTFKSRDCGLLFDVLPDGFRFTPPVPPRRAARLLRRAFLDLRKNGPVEASALMERACVLEKAKRAAPLQRYLLWTKLRAADVAFAPSFRLRFAGIAMRSMSTLPPRLRLSDYFISGLGDIMADDPPGWGYLVMACDERDEETAVDRMTDACQLAMGLANMYFTWDYVALFRTGRDRPDGALWLGPYLFAFDRERFLNEERIHYNPDFDLAAWSSLPSSMTRIVAAMGHVSQALRALEGHPFRDVLVRTLILMQEGFATTGPAHRLTRYWGALDMLYGEANPRNRTSERLIARASFAEIEPTLTGLKLAHACKLRNAYVHTAADAGDSEATSEFVRNLLGRHVQHWIHQGGDFEHHEAMLDFVDVPGDPMALQRMRTAIERRTAFDLEARRGSADDDD